MEGGWRPVMVDGIPLRWAMGVIVGRIHRVVEDVDGPLPFWSAVWVVVRYFPPGGLAIARDFPYNRAVGVVGVV
jgi:hypothetical protein